MVARFGAKRWHWVECRLGVALTRRPTRYFLPGDVLLVAFSNGSGERWHCFGYSSKLRTEVDVMQGICRYSWRPGKGKLTGGIAPTRVPPVQHRNRGPYELLELPGGADPRDPLDPGILALLLERQRAAVPASLGRRE